MENKTYFLMAESRINYLTLQAIVNFKFHCSYLMTLFIDFSVIDLMLPITTKLNVILMSECVNTWEF